VVLAGGSADDPTTLAAADYKAAIAISDTVDDINLLCIPDRQDLDVQMAMVAHCELMQDRFAILDSRRGVPPSGTGSVVDQLHGVEGNSGGYAALYFPWILVAPVKGSAPILVPPCGHIAGIYARTDQKRGVFKAPAGTEAGINGALGVDQVMTDTDQGQLNMIGVNVLRVFRPGDRPVVWGARTTATEKNANWQYVNIRRLFLFLEESIQEGIQWALFEPHNPALWQKLKRTINGFLLGQWRDGALFGNKPEEAFYIRIDEVLNTDYERSLGRLHIEIGVRPSYPAEFIIVRIGIWQGGSDVSET
jgi:phage tail sheath protein FI